MTEGQEEIEFLLGSENRTAVLEALKTAGRLDRYALEERLGSSRRTVTRTVNALEERNYIDGGENGYSLTAFGPDCSKPTGSSRTTSPSRGSTARFSDISSRPRSISNCPRCGARS